MTNPRRLQYRLLANRSNTRRPRGRGLLTRNPQARVTDTHKFSRKVTLSLQTRPMLDTMRIRRREAEMDAHYRKACWWSQDPATLYPGINLDNIFGKGPYPAVARDTGFCWWEQSLPPEEHPPTEFGGQLRYQGMKWGSWKLGAPLPSPPAEAFKPITFEHTGIMSHAEFLARQDEHERRRLEAMGEVPRPQWGISTGIASRGGMLTDARNEWKPDPFEHHTDQQYDVTGGEQPDAPAKLIVLDMNVEDGELKFPDAKPTGVEAGDFSRLDLKPPFERRVLDLTYLPTVYVDGPGPAEQIPASVCTVLSSQHGKSVSCAKFRTIPNGTRIYLDHAEPRESVDPYLQTK